ncbi:amidase [Niveispirillum sp. BGYR6]|uniref:amidase n=1 Tax=Niveispirillum sp. BGYR6 TaxID=2971249 RepID=UPI0022B99867|nr:amidase [Niveispirillum sp. BGYR6]MDG5497507.1 amidase [Niveispirillum sp. BGYR6]
MVRDDRSELPGSPEEIALLPACDLMALLRQRAIGSEELLNLYLDRLDRINPEINAVVVLDVDRARRAARDADQKIASGDSAGALLGLPMTVKETYEVEGLKTTCGLPMLANHTSGRDAVAVARLRAQGAVIFGKTNVPTGGADHQTSNPIYGLTRNPWALDRTPGGSSGGSAAALAAGLSGLELGSDIGGSIRIPAHFCGVFGHKASYGAISTLGHIPPMPGTLHEPQLAVAGPLARSARDLDLMMTLLTDPSPDKLSAASVILPPSRCETLRDFRVAVWTRDLPYATSAETVVALQNLADDLHRAGAKISETARPAMDPHQSFDIYLRTLFAIVLGGHPFGLDPAQKSALPADALRFNRIFEESSRLSPAGWQSLDQARAGLRALWQDFFQHWDVLIVPVFPTTAFAHDLSGEGIEAQLYRRRQVDDRDVVYLEQLAWPSLATVSNLPATVVPTPRRAGALPLGLQLIGPHRGDRTVIRLAELLERELGYVAVPPPSARAAHGAPQSAPMPA